MDHKWPETRNELSTLGRRYPPQAQSKPKGLLLGPDGRCTRLHLFGLHRHANTCTPAKEPHTDAYGSMIQCTIQGDCGVRRCTCWKLLSTLTKNSNCPKKRERGNRSNEKNPGAVRSRKPFRFSVQFSSQILLLSWTLSCRRFFREIWQTLWTLVSPGSGFSVFLWLSCFDNTRKTRRRKNPRNPAIEQHFHIGFPNPLFGCLHLIVESLKEVIGALHLHCTLAQWTWR